MHDDREIHDAIATIARAAERRHETEVVEQLLQAAARSARRGVVGLEATLAALADKRVDAIGQALAQGATVEFASGTELDRYGRIGVLTRYY